MFEFDIPPRSSLRLLLGTGSDVFVNLTSNFVRSNASNPFSFFVREFYLSSETARALETRRWDRSPRITRLRRMTWRVRRFFEDPGNENFTER